MDGRPLIVTGQMAAIVAARRSGVSDAHVSLEQILASREHRAACQVAALARFQKPLVSMTVVMPGPVKDGPLPRTVLAEALREVHAALSTRNWPVLWREGRWSHTGPEGIYVVDVEAAQLLKAAAVELEDRHPPGRLWDLDVIAPGQRMLSRQQIGLLPRRCLVCERPAAECGRARRHSLQELSGVMQRIVNSYDWNLYS
jgi:holo-ACP synthase